VQTFLRITVPMLRPTIIFVVITSTIGGLQIFDEPRMFDTGGMGGADRQWMTLSMYLYELGWGSQMNMGRSAAVAWLLFLVIVIFALINFAVTRRISSTGTATPRRRNRAARRSGTRTTGGNR
jgi:cellobiose transport system permease protein